MFNELGNCETKDCVPVAITLTDRLKQRRNRLASELKEVEAALSALEKQPEIEKLLNMISKVMR